MLPNHDPQESSSGYDQDRGKEPEETPDIVVETSCESFQLLDLQQGNWSDGASEQEAVDSDAVLMELV
jgi:hypothetical protein